MRGGPSCRPAHAPSSIRPATGISPGAQRLRYNQLHALYFNEQIAFFETALGQPVLAALLREPWPEGLAEGLRQFQEEERQHTEMFRRLNRLCAPHLYEGGGLHFVRVPAFWTGVMRWAVSHPVSLPLFLWLMLLQEERSLYYSRAYLRSAEPLEPLFVETHRRHLADEARHVRWDEELLDALWRGRIPSCAPSTRGCSPGCWRNSSARPSGPNSA